MVLGEGLLLLDYEHDVAWAIIGGLFLTPDHARTITIGLVEGNGTESGKHHWQPRPPASTAPADVRGVWVCVVLRVCGVCVWGGS